MCLIPSIVSADADSRVSASIEVYSGRGTVDWNMTAQEIMELAGRIQKLSPVQLKKIPTEGYALINNHGDNSFPYSQVYVFTKGMVIAESGSSKTSYLDDKGELMTWLLEQGDKHDPAYIAPKYKTLPAGTPYVAYTPASFTETVPQGALLRLKLTVFSEGNAPLEGSFETPEYVGADKGSFSLIAIEGIDDYTFTVDTSELGEKNGEITLKTNDPSQKEVKIPYKITVTGKTADAVIPDDTKPDERTTGGVNYFFYIIVLVVLAAVAFFVYAKRKTKK